MLCAIDGGGCVTDAGRCCAVCCIMCRNDWERWMVVPPSTKWVPGTCRRAIMRASSYVVPPMTNTITSCGRVGGPPGYTVAGASGASVPANG